MAAQLSEESIQQLEAQGLTIKSLMLIQLVEALTYAPLVNTFAALGEEVGWRGFLYPQLKARFGITAGRLIGGVIWGAWHFPLYDGGGNITAYISESGNVAATYHGHLASYVVWGVKSFSVGVEQVVASEEFVGGYHPAQILSRNAHEFREACA